MSNFSICDGLLVAVGSTPFIQEINQYSRRPGYHTLNQIIILKATIVTTMNLISSVTSGWQTKTIRGTVKNDAKVSDKFTVLEKIRRYSNPDQPGGDGSCKTTEPLSYQVHSPCECA